MGDFSRCGREYTLYSIFEGLWKKNMQAKEKATEQIYFSEQYESCDE